MFILVIIICLFLQISLLQAMDPIEPLRQKQMLLHYYNCYHIRAKEECKPITHPQANLALIYNNVTFLQEDEVKGFLQDLPTLYSLIKIPYFVSGKQPFTKGLAEQYAGMHQEFMQKLLDKQKLQVTYGGPQQQVDAIWKKIDQLDNNELRLLLRALVIFYSAADGPSRNKAILYVRDMHNKYPQVVPACEWKELYHNLDGVGLYVRKQYAPNVLAIEI